MTGLFSRTLVSLLLLWPRLGAGAATSPAEPKPVSFEIAATPPWVKPVAPGVPVTTEADNGGISYLLFDQQEQVAPRAFYYHEARQITSENGVQTGSAISASFDPSYQTLTFHFIRLVRNGVTAERLDRSQIKLLQREKDMESFLYDGAFTAHCQIEDVRVGDVIEFAYTIEGANPAKKGKFSTTLPTDWYYPVRRAVTRLVFPAQRKLDFKPFNRTIKPVITTENSVTDWLLEEVDVPARKANSDVPADYDPCGWVQISEWASWEQLVDWGAPLYKTDAPFSTDLQTEIDKLRGIHNSEERILAALRFVQDEIRYLGIESGGASYQPSAPSEVLRRRFGDCKDKAGLLTTLLRRTGIDATPAMVSSSYRRTVAERLPSPGTFDHIIVQVINGDKTYWLDATRSDQRGPLSQINVGDFGYALVLRPGNKTLTAFAPPRDSLPRKKVTENYRIPAPGGSGELDVTTEYHGLSAERIRSSFHESGREKIEKQYLQYYARRFPLVRIRQPLIYQEMPDENGCRVKEFYSIPEVWTMNTEEEKYELALYAGDVDEVMGTPGSSQREDPLALNYPVNVTQEINAKMFEDDWPLKTKDQSVTTAFYRYGGQANVRGRRLQFTYSYETLTDRVSIADLPAYNAGLSKLKDTLGYTLFYRTPAQLSSISRWLSELNWPIAALFVCILALTMFVSAWLIYKSELPSPLPPPAPSSPPMEGIGGWLVLVAIHHILRPIIFITSLVTLFPTVFNLKMWRLLTEPGRPEFDPYWAPALLFEIFYYSICFIFSGFLLILFFMKRAAWRRWYPIFLIVFVIGGGLDTYLARQISVAGSPLAENVRNIFQGVVAAAIWIPYCFVSKRVKATFRY
jgi:transglutaminase-like putative cysteine protease